jgi:hypothetical protein
MGNFPRSRNLVFVGIGLVPLVLWCVFLNTPSMAQNSAQGSVPLSPLQERVLQDQIPRHLPLKVKVKNLEKVKDLQNEEWLRDFEIEITNTSSKPIYFLSLAIYLPDVKSSAGYPIVFPLRYGRMDLIDFNEPLQPGDVPIQPEGIRVLKITASDLRGWEVFATESNLLRSAPKKMRLIFQSLNFGDKTGFSTTGGIAIQTLLKTVLQVIPAKMGKPGVKPLSLPPTLN